MFTADLLCAGYYTQHFRHTRIVCSFIEFSKQLCVISTIIIFIYKTEK